MAGQGSQRVDYNCPSIRLQFIQKCSQWSYSNSRYLKSWRHHQIDKTKRRGFLDRLVDKSWESFNLNLECLLMGKKAVLISVTFEAEPWVRLANFNFIAHKARHLYLLRQNGVHEVKHPYSGSGQNAPASAYQVQCTTISFFDNNLPNTDDSYRLIALGKTNSKLQAIYLSPLNGNAHRHSFHKILV